MKKFKFAKVKFVGWSNVVLNEQNKLHIDSMDLFDKTYNFAAVNVETSCGTIQIIAFNEHNGYYPHKLKASWKNYSDDSQEV